MSGPWTLTALVALPLAGGLLAAAVGRARPDAARWTALVTAVAELALALGLLGVAPGIELGGAEPFLEQSAPWIPRYGIGYHLAVDGLGLVFVLLTAVLGCIAVLVSWREIERSVGAHYLAILATLSGIMGVFLAWDLFLFYFFWELMLVPMYFLIGIWGHGRRIHAALKFMLFTLISGLLLLVAILGLYFAHSAAGGELSTDYVELLGTPVAPDVAYWLFLGFVVAFAVKLPAFPLHTWLPDAHTEAPTAGSVLLAGLLLKTGGYGLIRFAVPLFPDAARELSATLAFLGALGAVYGVVLALGQSDLKRMIAYTSIGHMGFVLLAVGIWNLEALEGAVVQMLAHGLATGALFAVAGMVQERLHTRDFGRLGGLWAVTPRLGAVALVFALANLGLPGTGNFVGEFLVLLGSYPRRPWLMVMALAGVVVGTVASLAFMRRTFFGPLPDALSERARGLEREEEGAVAGAGLPDLPDLNLREAVVLCGLAVAVIALGLVPQPVLDTVEAPLRRIHVTEAPFQPADPEIELPSAPETAPTMSRERLLARSTRDEVLAGRTRAFRDPDAPVRDPDSRRNAVAPHLDDRGGTP